jgi:hypothetical protein
MGWLGHVAHIWDMKNAYELWSENLKLRDHLEDLDVDGKVVSCMRDYRRVPDW